MNNEDSPKGAKVGKMIAFNTRVYNSEEIETIQANARKQNLYTTQRDGIMYISKEPLYL